MTPLSTQVSTRISTQAPLIAPSILAADWSQLAVETKNICDAGADLLHVDVMDGHFVPVITFGPQMVTTLKAHSSIPLDVHLMISQPERHIEAFIAAGADIVTVHQEACPHLHRTLQQIRECGAKAGVALNPGTPVSALESVIDEIDLLLLMTVNPGWGGQKFIPQSLERVRSARELITKSGNTIHLEVDGGVNAETSKQVRAAGADTLVAGTFVFGSDNYKRAIDALKE